MDLRYDPLGRLWRVSGDPFADADFVHDGDQPALEYRVNDGNVRYRFVNGPGADEPLIQYDGVDLATKRHLHADHQGSVIALTDAAGTSIATNRYDEYGVPQPTNSGRFGYTGQAWLKEIGLYYYKARMYSPPDGRFLQTDPVGYDDQVNLYAYVGNDPMNLVDPTGLSCTTREDGQVVDCKIDDPTGMTREEEKRATAAYQAAVDKLLMDPDKEVTLRAEAETGSRIARSTTTTQGEMARGLIEAKVSYRDQPIGSDGNLLQIRAIAGGEVGFAARPTYMVIFPNFFRNYSNATTEHERFTRSFIHESGHMTAAGNHLRETYTGDFATDHYRPWSIMAKDIYDGR